VAHLEGRTMAGTKLTKRVVEGLPAPHPSGKQVLVWDTDLKGFGVLLSGATGTKTYVVQRKLPGGLTRRVTIGACNAIPLDDKKDGGKVVLEGARSRAQRVLGDFYSGVDPKAERRKSAQREKTLRQALDGYLATNTGLAERSRDGYRRSVERYLRAWLDMPLREITREMVENRHRDIAAETAKSGRSGGGDNTGRATADGAMRSLRAIYNHAHDSDPSLPPNPVRLRKAWFNVQARETFLSGDQLPAFYAALNDIANQVQADYLRLVLFTGLRRGSAGALRWEQVDFASRVIRLPAVQMKGGKRRLDLPMSDYVRDLLVARRALGNDGGFVFPADSRSRHIEEPREALDRVREMTGIGITCHDLRRTYATHAEEADISVMALKALVNHTIGGDVTENYVRLTVDRLREPAQRVCDRLKMLCGIAGPPEGVAKLGVAQ
jgi:integrase